MVDFGRSAKARAMAKKSLPKRAAKARSTSRATSTNGRRR